MAKSVLRFLDSDVSVSDVTEFVEGVLGDGTLQNAGRHKFVLAGESGDQIVFKGDFTVENGVVTGGTIKGLTAFVDGEKFVVGTGYDLDYQTFLDALADGENVISVVFAADKAFGSKHDDVMFAVAKTLDGGDGDDTIVSSSRSKKILGGDGNDLIFAGLGNDKLFGGNGKDTFIFSHTDEAVDKIRDFEVKKDKIDFSPGDDFAVLGAAVEATEFLVGTGAATADQHIIYDAASGRLYFDVDGSGVEQQVLLARLDKGLKLTAGNFTAEDFFA